MVAAAEANQAAWLVAVARATGGEAWEDGPLRWAWLPFGREQLLLFPRDVPSDGLARGLEAARGRGARIVGCWGGPDTDDAPLLAAGLDPGWDPHWMTAQRADLPPAADDPRVEITADVPEYDAYGQALLTLAADDATGGAGAWHAVARVDGVYAGHAWAFAAAGVTGVYDVDVRPLFQRQGLGRALTLAVLGAAGAETITLNATGDGERLYRALGFRGAANGRTWWGTGGLLEV